MKPMLTRLSRRKFLVGLGAATGTSIVPGHDRSYAGTTRRYPNMIGDTRYHVTEPEDTLLDLARWNGLGFTEMIAANRKVDPWVPGEGARLVVPTAHILPQAPREGVVINLADQRLYVFDPDSASVESAPIGIGRSAWNTPKGRTKVVRKRANPTWYVPKSTREENPELPAVVPPGPDNPLGHLAIYLGWPSYLLHGTNRPDGVGRRVSHGCVRLYPEDISRLYHQVQIGTPVTVVDEEVKIAWLEDNLMLEVHPSQSQADTLEAEGTFRPELPPKFEYLLLDAAGVHSDRLDWPTIRRALRARTGVPVAIITLETDRLDG